MRPVKLTMEAFGSYGKKTVIDFEVPNQNIFLISGDTGAGKSTIFDAIVFALYGEASSSNNKKDGVELQSQYVGLDKEPYVVLDFAETYGGETKEYSVRRVPKHIRPAKRKGAKDQSVSEKVTLCMPDGTEYPQKEVNEKLIEIVGLTKDQFMQVAMIAQGEFMDLLRKKTTDKKEIFRRLFDTDIYKRITDELALRAKEKNTQIAKIRTICKQEISHIRIPENYDGAEELALKKENIDKSERLNTAEVESLLELLLKLCDEYEQETEQLKLKEQDAARNRDKKRDALKEADGLLHSFENLQKAQAELKRCEEEKESVEKAKQLSKMISDAFEIKQIHQRFEDAKKAVEESKKNLKDNREELPHRNEELVNEQNKESKAKAVAEEKMKLLSATEEKVSTALKAFDEIAECENHAQDKETEYKELSDKKEGFQKELEELVEEEKAWKKESEELKNAATLYEKWKSKKRILDELENDLLDVKKIEKEVERQKKDIQTAGEKYEKARLDFEKKDDEYKHAYWAFWNEQAGIMAKELKDGEPCPVCGALSHPSPAKVSNEHAHLDREALEKLENEKNALKDIHEKCAGNKRIAEERLEDRNSNFSEKLSKLGEKIAEHIGGIEDNLDSSVAEKAIHTWRKSVDEEGETLKKNVARHDKLQSLLEEAESKKTSLQEVVENASEKVRSLNEERSKIEGRLKALKENLQYTNREDALKEKNQIEKESSEANGNYDKARNLSLDIRKKVDSINALIRKYESELPEQETEQSNREEEYKQILESKDLSESEWKDIILNHGKSEVEELREKIAKHDKDLASAERAIREANDYIGDRTKPDKEALQAAYDLAENQHKETAQRLKEVEDCYKTNNQVYEALAPKMEERASVVEEYDRINSLHNRLAGKVTGARMDIETYVQRYYLERILRAANRRFGDMSAGQFELRMVKADDAGEGKNKGLDLMVYSEVTGKVREVRTLSGGESFMAALSLALGMADQIQEGSAAIGLDMMFIDEGFGSLDDHSRSQAVKVLKQMAGGTKLIGIISHVSELKQEIEDQLYVTKGETGSQARWND